MSEVAGKDCIVKVSGAPTSFTSEATSTSDNQSYQISNAVKQVLDRDTPPTVYDDAIETIEDYTVNYLNGTITFETVDALRGPITVTGKYLPMSVAAYAHTSSNSRACDLLDVTPFGVTHRKRIAGMLSASGTLSQFDVTDTTYITALAAGDPVVLEQVTASGEEPDRFWALLESTELQAALENPQDEVISWISHDSWLRLGA